MKRAIKLVVVLVLAVLVTAPATGSPEPQEEKPTVVKREERKPDQRVTTVIRGWRPWGTPSVPRVKRIIHIEAVRWGAPEWRLRCRIEGESGYLWYNENGQYKGLGQFHINTFQRGLSTIQTRRVRKVKHVVRYRRAVVVTYWSDGTKTKEKGRRYKVHVTRIQKGRIPKPTPWLHAWAQVRIMAQAMVGRSAVGDGEWDVRC